MLVTLARLMWQPDCINDRGMLMLLVFGWGGSPEEKSGKLVPEVLT